MKKLFASFLLLFDFLSHERKSTLKSETFNPEWKESFPGVWQSTINQPEDFNLLLAANKPPRVETLNIKSKQPFPVSNEEIKTFTKNGKTYLCFPLEKEEQIYGFGLNFKTVQQR